MFGADLVRLPCKSGSHSSRTFQDAVLAVIRGSQLTSSSCDALAASFQVLSYFDRHNAETCRSWQDQLHARIVIADSWDGVLKGKTLTHRDEVLLNARLFKKLDSCVQTLLLANGIRLSD
jgi:hypothetical protein